MDCGEIQERDDLEERNDPEDVEGRVQWEIHGRRGR